MTQQVTEADRQLAKLAVRKLSVGKKLTRNETIALRRVQSQQERETREKVYRDVPLADYQVLSGLSRKVCQSQAARYDIPCAGPSVDLYRLLPAVHAILSGKRRGPKATATADAKNFVALVKSGEAKAIDITRSVVQLVAGQVADSALAGTLSSDEVESIKKALQELRQAESDYTDLAKRQGELVPLDTVRAVVGESASRLVRCLEAVENSLATEMALWMADPTVVALGQDDRARKIREFVAHTCRTVRQREADDVGGCPFGGPETHFRRVMGRKKGGESGEEWGLSRTAFSPGEQIGGMKKRHPKDPRNGPGRTSFFTP